MKIDGEKIFIIFNYTVLILLMITILYPLYYMFIVSISDGGPVMRGEISLFPKGINLETYKVVLQDNSIMRSYANTIIYTTLGTVVAVFLTALCAYPLSRNYFFGKYLFTFFIIFTMFFDGGMIPKYLVIEKLGLINTMWALIIPPAINVWYMIIMRTFFQAIPESLHESAYMDGANDLTIFMKIVLPLSVPVLATMCLFYAVMHWNSFFPALIYLTDSIKYPVQLILRNIVIVGDMTQQSDAIGNSSSDFLVTASNIRYAVIFITILPIISVYPFIQKYFVKGIMVGSLKG